MAFKSAKLVGNRLPHEVVTWALDSERMETYLEMVDSADVEVLQGIVDAYNEAHGEPVKARKPVGTALFIGEVYDSSGRILLRTEPMEFPLIRGKGNSAKDAALSALLSAAHIARAKKHPQLDGKNLEDLRFNAFQTGKPLTYRDAMTRTQR